MNELTATVAPAAGALTAASAAAAISAAALREMLRRNRAVGADNDAIDPLLRLVELSFAMLLQLSPTLVGEDRFVELDLSAFEPPHDLLEFGERILETHRRDIGGFVGSAICSLLTKSARIVRRA